MSRITFPMFAVRNWCCDTFAVTLLSTSCDTLNSTKKLSLIAGGSPGSLTISWLSLLKKPDALAGGAGVLKSSALNILPINSAA